MSGPALSGQERRRPDLKKEVRVMENYRFPELVEKEKGFEFYQAFREEVDWIIGGKDDTFWFSL